MRREICEMGLFFDQEGILTTANRNNQQHQ